MLAHCRDGVHILETVNSVYAGRECHRLVATTHLKIRECKVFSHDAAGRVGLSARAITPHGCGTKE